MQYQYGEVRGGARDFEAFDDVAVERVAQPPQRINLEPDTVQQGLTQLVLSLVELIRQLMEKQAMRRIESGRLTEDQVDRLGTTLMRLTQQMEELKTHFGIDDLNIDLGPLGRLIDE